ncbi:2-hydroxyacid dehydrogenase [Chloroflexota bacterium]
MTKPKVFISRRIGQEAFNAIAQHAEVTAKQDEGPLDREELFRNMADKDGVMLWLDKVDSAFLDAAPNLKVIAHRAIGFDNIDVEEVTKRGIRVSNAPSPAVIDCVADFTFALMLASARRLVESVNLTFQGGWRIWDCVGSPVSGIDIHHRTLGTVGLGKIGATVAKRAKGFDMKVVYHDIVRSPYESEIGVEYVEDLPTLLGMSDIVSIHVPLTPETKHLIGAKELSYMKPTAILVNTARGPVVDQKALYETLKAKKIWGAALDVTEVEPIPPDDPLLTLPNVIIAPHIAGFTEATRTQMDLLAVENVVAALQGNPMPSCINCHLLGKK